MQRSTRGSKSEELLVEWLAEDNHYALVSGKLTRTEAMEQIMKVLGTHTDTMIAANIRRLERRNAAAVDFLRENGYSIHDVMRGEVSSDVEKEVRELFPYYQRLMSVFQEVHSKKPTVTDEEDTLRRVGAKKKRSSSLQTSNKHICGKNESTMARPSGIVSRTTIFETNGWNVNGPLLLGATLENLPQQYKRKMNDNVVKFQQQENDGLVQNQKEMQQVNLQFFKAKARLDLQSAGMSKEDAELAIPL